MQNTFFNPFKNDIEKKKEKKKKDNCKAFCVTRKHDAVLKTSSVLTRF